MKILQIILIIVLLISIGKVEIYNWLKEKTTVNIYPVFYIEGKGDKYISSYSEYFTSGFGVMEVEILGLKKEEIDVEKNNIEKLIGSKNIDWIAVDGNEIRVKVWISGKNAIEKLRELKDKLMKKGFEYSN